MELIGEEHVNAPPTAVWNALNDADVLRQCIPGCQTLEKVSDLEFAATVKVRIGPVSATFQGAVTLSDIVPEESYTISGEGRGGIAGFAKGGARVVLTAEGDGTKLSYRVDAQVGGKIAQLGSRLVDSTSKKLAAQFFSRSVSARQLAERAQISSVWMRAVDTRSCRAPSGTGRRRRLSRWRGPRKDRRLLRS